jgi:hypothetical protein
VNSELARVALLIITCTLPVTTNVLGTGDMFKWRSLREKEGSREDNFFHSSRYSLIWYFSSMRLSCNLYLILFVTTSVPKIYTTFEKVFCPYIYNPIFILLGAFIILPLVIHYMLVSLFTQNINWRAILDQLHIKWTNSIHYLILLMCEIVK